MKVTWIELFGSRSESVDCGEDLALALRQFLRRADDPYIERVDLILDKFDRYEDV